jgi:choline dehydrogenase-like flavoprotein
MVRAAMRQYGDPSLFSAHVNGTCRIGRNERTGGCAPDGQVFGHAGLYVMDGSLLPTAPGVNPHETIAAVVGILARKLVSKL